MAVDVAVDGDAALARLIAGFSTGAIVTLSLLEVVPVLTGPSRDVATLVTDPARISALVNV